ncbi:uncharacterized protein LOC127844790 isoform X4 [Dreissena polymorpha]|uniref:uncharacterized protein LOC127844790 isoform X4 n=1 Tax=Dreissena polymorpha TaxID=45954 RepID=UPI002264F972|nr:uncharacterized protein LOC127844790 isoform X4 [Dreissena polymorpha]
MKSYDMGTSRYGGGPSTSKYGGSSGYGGSSYLNTSYGTPRSTYRQSSYEPRLSSYVSGGSVMERIKQLNPESRSGSYTPLNSRRAAPQRDYSAGATSFDKYSSRSAGSDYSANNSLNRSGYLSDYGGSNPSLYGSWDRTSSRSGRYGGASRETSPVSSRAPPPRQYDYSSSATPSPYSTYVRGSEVQRSPSIQEAQRSPSVQNRYERQNSSRSDVYEESPPSRPRRKWEEDVYGAAKKRETSRDPLPEPVKPPPKDYSSDSDDSAPEDDKGHAARYLMSRGTSPMPEPGTSKRDRRSKELNSAISKVKRVKCPAKDTRVRKGDLKRRKLVDCATQTNLDEKASSKRSRPSGGNAENRVSREEMAKMAAAALLITDDNEGTSENFYKQREKFQQANAPLSPPYNKRQGGNFEQESMSPRSPRQAAVSPGWRNAVYDDTPPPKVRNEERESRFAESLDVPDEKTWRKSVYGEPPAPGLSRLKHYQTEEDLRIAVDGPRTHWKPKTSTPRPPILQEQDSTESPEEVRPPPMRDRRSHQEVETEKRRSQQSETEKRRSQQSETEKRRSQNDNEGYRRSSSRDSMLDDKPSRRRHQRTSSRDLLDESEMSQQSGRTALTPDTLSLRDSIEKVQSWKQKLPPGIQDTNKHLKAEILDRHPETGFPKSDSGEYFSAQEHNHSISGRGQDPPQKYHDQMYGQEHSPMSPMSPPYDRHTSEEDILSPGGNRRKRGKRHMSRELSQESSVFDEDRTHHPVNKEKMRKSELNRSAEKERRELEDLERRRRIYAGEDPQVVEESLRQQRGDIVSPDDSYRGESPSRRRSRYTSRNNSREDMLEEKRPRSKRESDPHASDSSHCFNREGSPNRPGSRSKRRSRPSSQEAILDQDDGKYIRPHSMVVSNESLAQMSAASSIPSMHSAQTDDGTIRNSIHSVESNEVQEIPSDEHIPQSTSHESMTTSGGSLPDIVPGEDLSTRGHISKQNAKKQATKRSGLIGKMDDIDNLLNFSPNEEEFVERGAGLKEIIRQSAPHIMDQPVPRDPSPLRPQNSEERLIDIDEPGKVSPLAAPSPASGRSRAASEDRKSHAPPPKSASAGKEPQFGQEMWDLLKAKKGLVVIGDILELCIKPKKPRFIRVHGKDDDEKSFRGYDTANELLESLQVDTKKLEQCALQIYRYHNGTQGDYSTYLDLESTIHEQSEDLDNFEDQRKNALILRTQLTVRVHAVIEKLLNSNGRELRRALFSLKQIFQDDKDLVHEFVNNDGLDCLIKVGADADQNYQNYILRALGQVMLYVDGMNGVINHNDTIQWLYSLLASKFRLVVKTALKLLLVFVEYTETNAQHLVRAVNVVDKKRIVKPWTNVMAILDEKDGGDSELLVYAMTLLNKVLSAIPDQDTFYDVADSLEELGMERITSRHMNKNGADLDLLAQFQLFESALKAEDGEDDEVGPLENLRRMPRIKSEASNERKSRRYSTGVTPNKSSGGMSKQSSAPSLVDVDQKAAEEYNRRKMKLKERGALLPAEHEQIDQMPDKARFKHLHQLNDGTEEPSYVNGSGKSESVSSDIVTDPPLTADTPRTRRDRRARQRDFINAMQSAAPQIAQMSGDRMSVASTSSTSTCSSNSSAPAVVRDATQADTKRYSSLSSLSDVESLDNQKQMIGRDQPPDRLHGPSQVHEESGYQSTDDLGRSRTENSFNESQLQNGDDQAMSNNRRWLLYKMQHKDDDGPQPVSNTQNVINDHGRDVNQNSHTDNKLENEKNNKVKSELERLHGKKPEEEGPKKASGPAGDKSGLISQRLESLNKKNEPSKPEPVIHMSDVKQTESELQWERLQKKFHRSLKINDMDFTDLKDVDDDDVFAPPKLVFGEGSIPVPPPPMAGSGMVPPPPMFPGMPPPPPMFGGPPPPPGMGLPPPPPMGMGGAPTIMVDLGPPPAADLKKTKKTLKLHWKIVQPEQPHPSTKGETIWKNIVPIKVNPDQLEHLFETRQAELKAKRQEAGAKKEITVLDPKRSNAINIGLTVLPPPRTIKTAILKMDNSIMNKEGIEKILNTMIPSEEEKAKILEAQLANPDVPLGTAEQFLLTLSSINELSSRLNVWLFKLDYESIESSLVKEIAEPLMDLKKGMDELHGNKTFKYILSAILTVGNFLNGTPVRGFSIEYLAKVPEVKDTVHKHSILHHLCMIIMEQFPESTDLYSEIGTLTRCSRVDWDELKRKLDHLELDCKASWDNLRAIIKHDGSTVSQLKSKMSEFLQDAAERIMILQIVHTRVINRYHKLLLYMGLPVYQAKDLKINSFCKIVSEFALEYRTTREKVLQLLEKKANQRERKKTRGKMIVDVGKFKSSKGGSSKKGSEDEEALQKVLANGYTSSDDRGLPGRQRRSRLGPADTASLKRSSLSGSRGCLTTDSEMYDTGDDELLEACVRTATTPTTRAPRERKKGARNRKSLRRTLKNGLDAEEMSAITKSEKV